MLEVRALDRLLHLPLGVEVGGELSRLLARAERAHEHEAAHALGLCGLHHVLCPPGHDPLEVLGLALDDGDEVDDHLAAFDGAADALQIGYVSPSELATPCRQILRPIRITNETAHRAVLRAQSMDDLGP